MSEFGVYTIGEVIAGGKGAMEGCKFELDDGGALFVVYFNHPTVKEKKQFQSGQPFEIRYTIINDILMITCKIGCLEWSYAPYTPHLSPNLTQLTMPQEGEGVALKLLLIDTSTGKIDGLRILGLSTDFTSSLFKDVSELSKKPFSSIQYHKNLKELYAHYSTRKLVTMSSASYKTNK